MFLYGWPPVSCLKAMTTYEKVTLKKPGIARFRRKPTMAGKALLGGGRRGLPWPVPSTAGPPIRNCFQGPEVSQESSGRGGRTPSSGEAGTSWAHTRIHPRSVCSEMLASAVPEVRVLSGRRDLGGWDTFQVREHARELAVGGQSSATPQQEDRQAGFSAVGSQMVPGVVSATHEDEQLTRKELRSRASGGAMESGAGGGMGDELRWTHEQGRSGFPGL